MLFSYYFLLNNYVVYQRTEANLLGRKYVIYCMASGIPSIGQSIPGNLIVSYFKINLNLKLERLCN